MSTAPGVELSGNVLRLDTAWQLASSEPGAISSPDGLHGAGLQWLPAMVPGTVAQSLIAARQWSLGSPDDYDQKDWWYQCEFTVPPGLAGGEQTLRFDGLATLADIWLNGEPLSHTNNMHLVYEFQVGPRLQAHNQLVICFRSLGQALTARRPRPRWKPRLVSHPQLRWFRTTLLGRIRGWCPAAAPIGPWRAITLRSLTAESITDVSVMASVVNGEGVLRFQAVLKNDNLPDSQASLDVGGIVLPLAMQAGADGVRISGELRVPDVELWWPHTHGAPHRYPVSLTLRHARQTFRHDLGHIGFRTVELDRQADAFTIRLNGQEIFCRGVCWTVIDLVSLQASKDQYRQCLQRVKQAGGNMVRLTGVMLYEQDDFYELCDELGILVWQDFMFDAMDYPGTDPDFREQVITEVRQQLHRLRRHACISLYCGNSDVELLAAMFGLPREHWRHQLFADLIPSLCAEAHPGIPYIPTAPDGGEWPFHVGKGVSSYYGIGAFRGSLKTVRRDDLRFVGEGMGFANLPDQEMIDELLGDGPPGLTSDRWKQRIPKDDGLDYDFDDVRDHYVQELYGVDPSRLRDEHARRYLDLGRLATGEALLQVYSEWRSSHSRCRGALVWFLKDFWPGAGFGLLDSRGHPKACYYFVRRAWQTRTVLLTNEGLNGVHLHVLNESPETMRGTVELQLLRSGEVVTATASQPLELLPGTTKTISADTLLNGFYDTAYAYRFGPPGHNVVMATLYGESGQPLAQNFLFPHANEPAPAETPGLQVTAVDEDSQAVVRLQTQQFLYGVRIVLPGYLPEDNYFHLAPGRSREIRLHPDTVEPGSRRGRIEAVNLATPFEFSVDFRDRT